MIEVKNLNKTYDRGRLHANHVLHDISLELPETGFVCILGPSGCGKTSLLNAIGGLDRFDKGTLSVGKTKVSRYGTRAYENVRNHSFGYIFQNYYLLMDHSVAYNVYLGLHSLALSHKEKIRRVRQALKAVEMEHYLHRRASDLSGGQQQRVAIARALARQPRVIFADEPTGNLDEANTLNICTLLRKISRTSLVVMVTHEENIANFFADRIIRLKDGRIVEDISGWERNTMSAEGRNTLYAGDYHRTDASCGSVELQVLAQEGAQPVKLTVVALRDRIVIKLDDDRAVTCGASEQNPKLLPGKRPELDLKTMEDEPLPFVTGEKQKLTRAGRGLTLPMQLREAKHLFGGGGARQVGMRLFLILLTVLLLLSVSDYYTVASIDPEDFITSDSHVLELNIKQGSVLYPESKGTLPMTQEYLSYLRSSKQDFLYIPHVVTTAKYEVTLFKQMDSISINFGKFSYVPLSELDESTLIAGRMPKDSREIVVDRWILDAIAEKDGIIQNSIKDASYFLGCTFTYEMKTYGATIVGICDSGEPAVYMDTAGLVSIGVSGIEVTPLSELKAQYPGVYDDVTLTNYECIVVVNNAGKDFVNRIGGNYSTSSRKSYIIQQAIEADVDGRIIVNDAVIEDLLWDMVNQRFYLYCRDKAAMLEFLQEQGSSVEKNGYAIVEITDDYADTYGVYEEATTQKADARTIVTVTIIVICLVMLYLLQRAKAQSRIGMLAVYRLLGIPKRKLSAIFFMESLLCSVTAALPATVIVWGVIDVIGKIPELGFTLLLPWQLALIVFGCILLYHIFVSLRPTSRLLRMPPAQLAAKYDM